jgi:DNA polymerase III delta prime subunit
MEYLSRLAAEKDIHDTEELRKRLDPNTNEYYISELDEIFNDYFSEHLRKTVFPAYTKCSTFKAEKKIGDGSAADKLSEMIGLKSVKDIITKSVNYYKLHEAYKERNIIIEEPARSMIFTGNPGTAKTTVARLTAKIFRENGILEHGNLIEVGRGDLVGQFVGWTAPIIQNYFRKAKGSILFIDEAYSLVDDSNSYGDEAINTIVNFAEGDMRKSVNMLQSAASTGSITEEHVFEVVSKAKPQEIKNMVNAALIGDFMKSRDILREVMIMQGTSGEDMVNQIYQDVSSRVMNGQMDGDIYMNLIGAIAETDFRIREGANPRIQLEALLAKFL